jgi:hypothetical protein
MKTILCSLAIAVTAFAGLTGTAAAGYGYSNCGTVVSTYVSGHYGCGCAIYTQRYIAYYNECGYPVYGYRVLPVVHHCYRDYDSCRPRPDYDRPHRSDWSGHSSGGVRLPLPPLPRLPFGSGHRSGGHGPWGK